MPIVEIINITNSVQFVMIYTVDSKKIVPVLLSPKGSNNSSVISEGVSSQVQFLRNHNFVEVKSYI